MSANKKLTRDQEIAYEILTKIFKMSHEDAMKIIEKYSGAVTGISKLSRPYAEKVIERILLGKAQPGPFPPGSPPPTEKVPSWVWITGGVLIGVMFLTFMFKTLKEK